MKLLIPILVGEIIVMLLLLLWFVLMLLQTTLYIENFIVDNVIDKYFFSTTRWVQITAKPSSTLHCQRCARPVISEWHLISENNSSNYLGKIFWERYELNSVGWVGSVNAISVLCRPPIVNHCLYPFQVFFEDQNNKTGNQRIVDGNDQAKYFFFFCRVFKSGLFFSRSEVAVEQNLLHKQKFYCLCLCLCRL